MNAKTVESMLNEIYGENASLVWNHSGKTWEIWVKDQNDAYKLELAASWIPDLARALVKQRRAV